MNVNNAIDLPPVPSAPEVFSMLEDQKKMFVESTLNALDRKGIPAVLEFLRTTDYYTAPSSMSNHSNFQGGLVEHSILVYSLAMRIREGMVQMNPELDTKIPKGSVALSALLHDLCKCCFYKAVMKNKRGEDGQWTSYVGYTVEDQFPIGHGEKSVIMLQDMGLSMTPEEMLAIRYHMGCWDGNIMSNDMKYAHNRAVERAPLVVLIQTADYMSSLVYERKINI